MSENISRNLEDLIENTLNSTLIKDSNVFTPQYYPNELPHRQKEVENTIKHLAPVLKNQKPNNQFLYGKSGTGKTVVAAYVAQQIQLICEKRGVKLRTHHVNCKANNTRYAFLRQIPKDKNLIPRTGFSLTTLHELIEEDLHNGNEHILLIADEVDQLKNADDIMYRLSRINDERKSPNMMTFIAISNDVEFRTKLSPRTKSALCESEIIFNPYNAVEMMGILEQRAELGLSPNAIGKKELNTISAWAARDSGDARHALKLLEKSATIAQDKHRTHIIREDLDAAKDQVEVDLTCQACEGLPEPERVLLLSLAIETQNNGKHPISSGTAFETYEKLSTRLFPNHKPNTIRWMQIKLGELEQIGLLSLTMSGKGFRGQSRFIQLNENHQSLAKFLAKKLEVDINFPTQGGLKKWA